MHFIYRTPQQIQATQDSADRITALLNHRVFCATRQDFHDLAAKIKIEQKIYLDRVKMKEEETK